ncbi:MAG: hypothetical protein WCM76_01460 [Bacteroidota bacterium]
MRKIAGTLLFTTVMLCVMSCGPTSDQAIAYNDKIIDQQVAIINKMDGLNTSFKDWSNKEGMDKAYAEAIKQVEVSITEVTAMDAFDKNTEFKEGALSLFKVYKSVLDNEYKEMVALYKLPDNLFTKEQEDKWTSLSEQALNKMDNGLNELKPIQSKFAEKYKFEINKTYHEK